MLLFPILAIFATSSVKASPLAAGRHFVFRQSVPHDASIIVQSTTMTPIQFYTRYINLPSSMDVVTIDWTLPFCGIDQSWAIGRVHLLVNGQPVSDASFVNRPQWQLHQLHLKAVLPDVPPGNLMLEIRASSGGKSMNLPHFNPNLIEATQSPRLTSELTIIGIPK